MSKRRERKKRKRREARGLGQHRIEHIACPFCAGTGTITDESRLAMEGIITASRECPDCTGTGRAP